MSNTLWWTLAGSIPVALIIMAIAYFWSRAKVKKITAKKIGIEEDGMENKAINRPNNGELLWDEKEKAVNPLADLSLEWAVNTALKNEYKTLLVDGFDSDYEEKTLKQLANLEMNRKHFDFALVNFSDKLIDQLTILYKHLMPRGIIMIVNVKKGKDLKDLEYYFKYSKMRNEYHKKDTGIILIAK